MRQVTGIVFARAERDELRRALRWIGLHPEADLASSKRRGEQVRVDLQATINGLADDRTPVFSERLEVGRTVLGEMLAAAKAQSEFTYWTARDCTADQAWVLIEARQQAADDLVAALAVLDAAAPYVQPAHLAEEDKEEGA